MSENERRQHERLDSQQKIYMELSFTDSDGSIVRIDSHTLDISQSGMRVLLKEPLPEGFIAQLCIEDSNGQLLLLFGELKWCKQSDEGYECGFQLLDAESSDLSAWTNLDSFNLEK